MDRARENKRDELFDKVSAWVSSGLAASLEEPLAQGVKSLRSGERSIEPFHWEIEFPEVMARDNGGFDAFVGNPPFANKNTIATDFWIGSKRFTKSRTGTPTSSRTFSDARSICSGLLGPLA